MSAEKRGDPEVYVKLAELFMEFADVPMENALICEHMLPYPPDRTNDRLAQLARMAFPTYGDTRTRNLRSELAGFLAEGAFYHCGIGQWVYDTDAQWSSKGMKSVLLHPKFPHIPLNGMRRHLYVPRVDIPVETQPKREKIPVTTIAPAPKLKLITIHEGLFIVEYEGVVRVLKDVTT
jgi:hypothetical protein